MTTKIPIDNETIDLTTLSQAITTAYEFGGGRKFWTAFAHDKHFSSDVAKLANARGYLDLTNRFFIHPSEQLQLARQRNQARGWGFTEKDFASVQPLPKSPKGALRSIVLDVSLGSVKETFEEAWTFAALAQPAAYRWEAVKSSPRHLRLLPGTTIRKGLAWVIVDLGSNSFTAPPCCPLEVRSPQHSPHAAILWAASYFPRWVQAMDDYRVPRVWLPGYQLTPDAVGLESKNNRWRWVPRLSWDDVNRRLILNAHYDTTHQVHCVVPRIMKRRA